MPFIRDAVTSVLQQTWDDFELVVLDNASTDSTLDEVRGILDPRLRIVAHPCNIGLEANWDCALAEARGMFFKLLCADDRLHPECLTRQVAAFQEGPSLALVCCGRRVIDERGRTWCVRRFPGEHGCVAAHEAVSRIIRAGTNLIGEPAAVLMRTDQARSAGSFKSSFRYVGDLDYWLRVLRRGDLYVIREPLCDFRLSRQSFSYRERRGHSAEWLAFYAHLRVQGYAFGSLDQFQGELRAKVNGWLRSALYGMALRT